MPNKSYNHTETRKSISMLENPCVRNVPHPESFSFYSKFLILHMYMNLIIKPELTPFERVLLDTTVNLPADA